MKIETSLGIHHALRAGKNLLLMTGSYALSIILFLSFSVMIEFGHQALKPLRPYSPDLSVISNDRACRINHALADRIAESAGVKRVFGRMYRNLPAKYQGQDGSIDLISYEEHQFAWAEESLVAGELSRVSEGDGYVLTVHDKSNSLSVGDKIQLGDSEIEVAGVLDQSPFDTTDTPTVICGEKTFARLTGENDYAVIDIQLEKKASDEEVNALRALVGNDLVFSDRRESNRDVRNIYYAFIIFVYGFLLLIAMITVLNIVNSIAMSVSAKIREYGIMRAVGMEGRQITGMIAAETFTYGAAGLVIGCIIGQPLYGFLFKHVITAYWGTVCKIPITETIVIIMLIVLASFAAVYSPVRRIRNMSITDTINEL